jgi:mannosyltransferase OCH1-like enzyme
VQFWDAPEPPADLAPLMESWRALNPGWSYQRFDLASATAFLKARAPAAVQSAFLHAGDAATKADLFRLAFLALEGGVYADADDRCLAPLEPVRASGVALFGYQEDVGSLANDLIGAAPGHPMLARALADASAALLRGDRDMPWLCTGPRNDVVQRQN